MEDQPHAQQILHIVPQGVEEDGGKILCREHLDKVIQSGKFHRPHTGPFHKTQAEYIDNRQYYKAGIEQEPG